MSSATDNQDRIDKITRVAGVWETGDVDQVDPFVADGCITHTPPFPDMDNAAWKEFVRAFHAAFQDFEVFFDDHVFAGDTSVHRWHCRGVYSGESTLLPPPPTGKESATTGCHVIHWREGKMAEIWHFGDWLGFLQGAGVLPPMG
jgi:ketosteroid isomerase-like protein